MSVLGFDAVVWGEELGGGGFGASMFFGAGSAGISAGMRGSAWARERPALLPIANFWVWWMRDAFDCNSGNSVAYIERKDCSV